jgi:hypothetical protein
MKDLGRQLQAGGDLTVTMGIAVIENAALVCLDVELTLICASANHNSTTVCPKIEGG